MQPGHAGGEDSPIPGVLDALFHERLRPRHGLLDAPRVNAAVPDQGLQRQTRGLSANGVERGNDHGLRRVVNNEVYPGQLLEGADIAAFSADNPPLHLIRRQRHRGHRGLRHLLHRTALDGHRDDLPRPAVRFSLGLLFDLFQQHRRFVPGFPLCFLQYETARLVHVQTGDPLGFFSPVQAFLLHRFAYLRDLRLFLLDHPVALLQGLRTAFQRLLPLTQPALRALQVLSALPVLSFHFLAQTVRLILGLQQRFFTTGLQIGAFFLQIPLQIGQ